MLTAFMWSREAGVMTFSDATANQIRHAIGNTPGSRSDRSTAA
jgi:hypothetical protein